jgi:two-component sensor histidine kinase
LQIISSLINLQLSKDIGDNSYGILKDINNKIISLALVHQKLHKTETGHTVNLNEYTYELIQYILQSFSEINKIDTHIEIEELKTGIEDTVHIGLILNELTTNAIKYGKTNEGLNLELTITEKNNLLTILFADHGKGFQKDFKIDGNDSFGLGFIQSMIQSYNGSLKIENNNGAKITITLKLETYS